MRSDGSVMLKWMLCILFATSSMAMALFRIALDQKAPLSAKTHSAVTLKVRSSDAIQELAPTRYTHYRFFARLNTGTVPIVDTHVQTELFMAAHREMPLMIEQNGGTIWPSSAIWRIGANFVQDNVAWTLFVDIYIPPTLAVSSPGYLIHIYELEALALFITTQLDELRSLRSRRVFVTKRNDALRRHILEAHIFPVRHDSTT